MEQHQGNANVGRCLNRFRSYEPNTDTFLGYDGRYNPGNSPF
ncbi:MAG: BA14K family protein [Rhizobiales bacterium]|nr:BA14K family protein [Hyphomicrobiales bacterium]